MTPAFVRGWTAEDQFKRLLGDKIRKASAMEDMLDHWDFEVKIDVKKVRAADDDGESTFHWIEIKNVQGHDGWLYGKADCVAFETKSNWIVVPMEALREFTKENAIREFTKERFPYKYYRREGRRDMLIMVPTPDLLKVKGSFNIPKP